MAEYVVYELLEDGTARHPPIIVNAGSDSEAYVEAARIASPENWVVEVWLGPNLIWHLEPSPGRRPRGVGPCVESLVGDDKDGFCPGIA